MKTLPIVTPLSKSWEEFGFSISNCPILITVLLLYIIMLNQIRLGQVQFFSLQYIIGGLLFSSTLLWGSCEALVFLSAMLALVDDVGVGVGVGGMLLSTTQYYIVVHGLLPLLCKKRGAWPAVTLWQDHLQNHLIIMNYFQF